MINKSSTSAKGAKIFVAIILAFSQMSSWGAGADKTPPTSGTLPSGIESKQPRAKTPGGRGSWSFNAKIIEACSCRLFCPCFFNTSPDKHFCQFNNVFKVLAGYYGPTDLTDVKFWVSGDLGDDLADGKAAWAALTFDPATTQEQIDAIAKIIPHIYPLQFEETYIDKKPISWEINGDGAIARIGDGTDGTVELTAFKDKATGKTAVIKNLNYFGAKQNKGFALHKSKHNYRGFGHEYAFEDANGFVIEIYSSGDLPHAHY